MLAVLSIQSHVFSADMPTNTLPDDVVIAYGVPGSLDALGFGWSYPERPLDLIFTWIDQLEADVYVEFPTRTDIELWIHAAPFYLPQYRQVIGFYMNNQYVGERMCHASSDFEVHHITIPSSYVKAGQNTLTLRMAYRRKPAFWADRELALAVSKILIRPGSL